jgi:hypothetical protein
MTMRISFPLPLLLALAGAGVLGISACDALVGLVDPDDPGEPEVRSVQGVTTDVAAIVGTFSAGPLHRPFLLESMPEFEKFYGGVHPLHEASFHVRAFFQNGGRQIWVSRAAAATQGGLLGGGVPGRGLLALEEANRFNTLLVPELLSSASITDRAFAAATAIAYAASRDAMMLLDPPAEVLTAQGVMDWVNQSTSLLRSRHAALYFGRIEVPEGAGPGETRWIGASGAAAGIQSWNDRERGVWLAPAGPNVPSLAGVLDTDPLTTAEREALNTQQIISLLRGPARIWGARTLLADSSPFTYLNVQRLTLHIEALVRDTLRWTAGETMKPELWTQARSDTEAVIHALWSQGAFPGSQPQEAYFVRCDASTHTSADIAAGRLKVHVGFAPLKPGEFVVRILTLELR